LTNIGPREKALAIGNLALEKKAEDVKVLDMRNIASFCDYFVIAGAESSKKTTAIAEHIADSLDKIGVKCFHKEGLKEAQWIILDYFDVVFHILQKNARKFYDLERLWGDAQEIAVKGEK
jgi:ribosome-associated protein